MQFVNADHPITFRAVQQEAKLMPKAIVKFVYFVEKINYFFGRIAMYGIFLMIGVLFYSTISKTFFNPSLWTLEMAQFLMASYYLLGGAYSMQLGDHVRMDLLYGQWSPKHRGFSDSITSFFLVTYLIFLLYGGIGSTQYALKYGETSYSSWAPYMAPIKLIMVFGIALMILQTIATFFRDVAKSRGKTLEGEPLAETYEEARPTI